MGMPSLYAVGAFLSSRSRRIPGIEKKNSAELGNQAHVYVGTGCHLAAWIQLTKRALHSTNRRSDGDAFWAAPERNSELRHNSDAHPNPPPQTDQEEWNRYWMARSPELKEYLAELLQKSIA